MIRPWLVGVFVVASACHRKHGAAYQVDQFAAHGARACASMKDGRVRCWGRDGASAVLQPRVLGPSGVAQVCVGDAFACMRKGSGDVSCTGSMSSGAGAANEVHGATDLACGDDHACAIVAGSAAGGTSQTANVGGASREVVCWAADKPPAAVEGARGAKTIAAGGGTTCAVFDDGMAKCWGRGKRGQLGSGAFEDSDRPVTVVGAGGTTQLLDVKSIAVGREHACAVLRDETVACFGANDDGQLGDGGNEASATPKRASGVNIAVDVACGAHHTCARLGDSTVSCWGKNDVHQSGISASPNIAVPTRVVGLYEANGIALGEDFTCARMQDGWLRCFGVNDWGQLGDGTTEIRNVPTPIRF